MFRRLVMTVAAIATAAVSSNATAEVGATASPFASTAVSDDILNGVRGTASPYAQLSRAGVVRLAEAQSRSDFRLVGSITNLQMDAWWGTIGSELIANAVRNQP